tara:strand:+ start:276 stop:569 length:294 start_codon:yes stop_codon:yes gene_type:complete
MKQDDKVIAQWVLKNKKFKVRHLREYDCSVLRAIIRFDMMIYQYLLGAAGILVYVFSTGMSVLSKKKKRKRKYFRMDSPRQLIHSLYLSVCYWHILH